MSESCHRMRRHDQEQETNREDLPETPGLVSCQAKCLPFWAAPSPEEEPVLDLSFLESCIVPYCAEKRGSSSRWHDTPFHICCGIFWCGYFASPGKKMSRSPRAILTTSVAQRGIHSNPCCEGRKPQATIRTPLHWPLGLKTNSRQPCRLEQSSIPTTRQHPLRCILRCSQG